MGLAKGAGKCADTDWTDLTIETDDEHIGQQPQGTSAASGACSGSTLVPFTRATRECKDCHDVLADEWPGLTCRRCQCRDILYPDQAVERQQFLERFPTSRPPGMPPMMPREDPTTIRKQLKEAAMEAKN